MLNSVSRIKNMALDLVKKLNSITDGAPPKDIIENFKSLSDAKDTLIKSSTEQISDIANQITAILSISGIILKKFDGSLSDESKENNYNDAKTKRDELIHAFKTVKSASENELLKSIEWIISEANKDLFNTASELSLEMKKERKLSSQTFRAVNHEINQAKEKLDAFQEQSVKIIDDALKKANDFEAEIASNRDKVHQILGAISDDAVMVGYSQAAYEEKKVANFFRFITLFLMFLMLGVVSVTLFEILYGNYYLTWESFASRVILTLVISIPTAYCAKESTRHREKHYKFKQAALDINAIQPYLRNLDKNDQDSIRKDFAIKLFINNEHKVNQEIESMPLDINSIANKITESVIDKIKEKI